jgi:Mrp family chromosome partitioning ATPase
LVDAILDEGIELERIVENRPAVKFSLIRAGHAPENPYELLRSARFGELMDEVRRRFDYVIVDTPPLVSVQDCRVMAHRVDGFVLVVSAHRTPRALVEEALRVVGPTKVIGFVFNRDDQRVRGYYSRYYGAHAEARARSERQRSEGAVTRLLTAVGGRWESGRSAARRSGLRGGGKPDGSGPGTS